MTNAKKTADKKPDEVKAPAVAQTAKERREDLNRQFAEADEKGRAAIIEETQAGLGVRGY